MRYLLNEFKFENRIDFFGDAMKDKSVVYMMIGIPGSGKSTWIRNNRKDTWVVVSPDAILETQYNYEWTPERASEAWALSYQQFGHGLLAGKTMVWDATFTSPIMRAAILHTAKGAGYLVEAIFCDTPIELCIERNQCRNREPVPESTIRRMAENLQPPTKAEGFDRVEHIQVKYP